MSNANSPAFPIGSGDLRDPTGLTKREYFAGLVMQGLLANLVALRKEGFRDSDIEEFAVIRADKLLAELAK